MVLGQFSDSFLEILNPIREKRQCLSTHVSLEARISYLNCDCFEQQVTRNSSFMDFLTSLLGEVRRCLGAPCIPEPSTWVVVQWHLNRDSEEISGDGLSFQVTFRDFFNDVARFYYKHKLKKVRAEAIQNPSRSIKDVFETILNREQIWQEGDS